MTTSRLFRRKAKRYRLRVFVRYGSRDLDHRGFTTDISTSGIAIKTNQVYPPGTELLLGLEINERILLARGRVKWAKQVPPLLINYVHCGMGIEFIATSKRLRRFLFQIDAQRES